MGTSLFLFFSMVGSADAGLRPLASSLDRLILVYTYAKIIPFEYISGRLGRRHGKGQEGDVGKITTQKRWLYHTMK